MPLIKLINTKPDTKDIVQICFTDLQRNRCYLIKNLKQMHSENRYRGNCSRGKFDTSDELWDHIQKYIEKKEGQGYMICVKN